MTLFPCWLQAHTHFVAQGLDTQHSRLHSSYFVSISPETPVTYSRVLTSLHLTQVREPMFPGEARGTHSTHTATAQQSELTLAPRPLSVLSLPSLETCPRHQQCNPRPSRFPQEESGQVGMKPVSSLCHLLESSRI
jgi:hypothetical protein